jgi:DNA-binding transcriptional LysR family regulator
MKKTMRFTQYPDAVAAAVAGQGLVIGRLPLLAELLQDKRLVAPFSGGAVSRRAYYIVMSDSAAGNADAQAFAQWLRSEAETARQLL